MVDLCQVDLREGESIENLLRRFRAAVQGSGVLREVKEREFFRSKGEKARIAARRGARRAARREKRAMGSYSR